MSGATATRGHIELQRVKPLFLAVPRLRAMVGPNSPLGDTVQVALPNLAREAGRRVLVQNPESCPNGDPNDALKAHAYPAADAGNGIAPRGGEYFTVQLACGADALVEGAAQLLPRRLCASVSATRLGLRRWLGQWDEAEAVKARMRRGRR